ncbi:MAG: restriction endonuclease [Flavobacteriales bacterium]|nr:restriction endonuclease [Flavobacteriales bacterium]MCB9194444.1 restriction endonuclease [Flavobacteriales bacterium]
MAVPDFQSIMLPLLDLVNDKKDHRLKDLVPALAEHFELSEQERNELLPSGRQARFYNRVIWASTYLRKAGLLNSPSRATVHITDRGKEALDSGIAHISIGYLKRYPEFVEFQTAKRNDTSNDEPSAESNTRTPEEVLDDAYEQIEVALADELLSKVHALTWMDFERFVVQLLVKMGYGGSVKDAGRALTKGNDEGIDGTIKEDKLGLDVIYIQAKKWQTGNTVGRPEIQKFVGALAGQGAKKGIFITTSSFTKEAREYQPRNETKIVLIDGEELTQLMIDHDLGVTTQRTYAVKRIDSDFFGEE